MSLEPQRRRLSDPSPVDRVPIQSLKLEPERVIKRRADDRASIPLCAWRNVWKRIHPILVLRDDEIQSSGKRRGPE